MEFLKFLGKNSKDKFYARDFRNNYRFRPDVNPPRIKFEGYVNFVFNRDLASFLDLENHTFKTNISSLVRTAKLPSVTFKNQVKNQFNKKKIVATGVEYNPVEITVFDTLNNEWLIVLMRYFSYLFMNPRNRNADGDRDVRMNTDFIAETKGSQFATSVFKSNEAGLNLQRTKQFFERIDIIMYHGGKGVQYSLTAPIINSFDFGDMDYSTNEFVEFSISVDYENFTTYDVANFDLGGVDLDRFEKVVGLNFASDEVMSKPLGILDDGVDMAFLGNSTNDGSGGTAQRTAQPLDTPIKTEGDESQAQTQNADPNNTNKTDSSEKSEVQKEGSSKPLPSTYDQIDLPISKDPSKKVGKSLLSTAILAKLSGQDVGDAVKNFAITVVADAAQKKLANVQVAPKRGENEEGGGS